jgi:hypothetical protein
MKFVPIVIMVILVIVLVYFLYLYYSTKSTSLTTVKKLNLNNTNSAISIDSLTSPNSTRYAYGMWIYVNTWNSTVPKILVYRNSTPPSTGATPFTNPDFALWLDASTPTLYCNIGSTTKPNANITVTNNFPIQKWTQVIVSVDDTIVDIYLDGKLIVSNQLPNIPIVSANPISFGYPYDIYLAVLNRWSSALDPNTAWNSYLSGSSSLGSSSYNVQLSVFKDQVETNSFNIV